MPNQPRRPAFFWFVVCTVPLYAALWLFSGHVLVREFHHSKAFGWTMTTGETGHIVASVDENGPAARPLIENSPTDGLLFPCREVFRNPAPSPRE